MIKQKDCLCQCHNNSKIIHAVPCCDGHIMENIHKKILNANKLILEIDKKYNFDEDYKCKT